MSLKQLEGYVFDKETGAIGAIAGVDFIKRKVSILLDDDSIVKGKLENAVYLEQIGYIGKIGIINHDVVGTIDGKHYEIELVDGDKIQLHLLNNKLERVAVGDTIEKTDLAVLEPYVTLIGNLYELEAEKHVDFNIRVLRKIKDGDVTYYYACNNEKVEEVDLIKVVFIGSHILEEEKYERITLSHEEYLEAIENAEYKEVTAMELQNYVLGMTHGKDESEFDADDLVEEDEEYLKEENVCQECGEANFICECEEEWE